MSQTTQTRRLIDVQALQNIIASRAIIKTGDIGKTMRFHVAGNGNVIPVINKDKEAVMSAANPREQLYKKIYNLKANSQVAMVNERNRALLNEAVKSEGAATDDAGVQKTSELCNQYLNKVQVSFSTLLPYRHDFYDGQLIEAEVIMITTDNGSLITLENPRAVAIEKAGKTPAFTLADLLGSDKPEDVFQPATAGAGAAGK